MKMLVTFAVNWEFKPWLRLRAFRQIRGNQQMFQTEVAGGVVEVLLTGIGPQVSMKSIKSIPGRAPDLCISSGLAGGLKLEHQSGEVLVARASCAESDCGKLESSEELLQSAVKCGAKAVSRFVSSSHVVWTSKEKSELHPKADAVDMETFGIMREMSMRGVPCVAVRAVADGAEADLPLDFERALDASGRIRITHVLGRLASDPRQAWPLARFGAQSSRAASALARYLDGYTAFLAMNQKLIERRTQEVRQ